MATANGNRHTARQPSTRREPVGAGKLARAVHEWCAGTRLSCRFPGGFIGTGTSFGVEEAVNTLKDFLEAVYHKFQLPIWLTEYSLIRWSDPPVYPSWEQQEEFAAKSVEMLETLSFVERYAWYSLPPWTNDGSDTTALYYPNGEPTPVGTAYRKAGLKAGPLPSAR
jgi:hypothetical protein